MIATVVLQIPSNDFVPREPVARAAWLETHGPQDQAVAVSVSASLPAWARCHAFLRTDGTVSLDGHWEDPHGYYLVAKKELLRRATARLAQSPRDVALGEEDIAAAAELVEQARAARAIQEEEKRKREEEQSRRTHEASRRTHEARATRIAQFRDKGMDALLKRDRGEWRVDRSLPCETDREIEEALGQDCWERGRAEAERRNVESRAPYRSALQEVARRHDDLARPAAEGYPVEKAVLDRLARELVAHVLHHQGDTKKIFHLIDDRSWGEEEDRAAPTPETFRLLDQVIESGRFLNSTIPIALGQWVFSRIVRVDVCPHEGHTHKVTCVFATLENPFSVREVTFSFEDLSCHHEEEDEE